MTWFQKEVRLSPRGQGVYLVTDELLSQVPELSQFKIGMANFFVKHTSAGITLNENYDPDVRTDMSNAFAKIAPESEEYLHNDEGPDDMPAHIRAALVGVSVDVPIRNGRLCTGTWQGIYLCEFRKYRHTRTIVVTLNGDKN